LIQDQLPVRNIYSKIHFPDSMLRVFARKLLRSDFCKRPPTNLTAPTGNVTESQLDMSIEECRERG
jgi:hypothetical protein